MLHQNVVLKTSKKTTARRAAARFSAGALVLAVLMATPSTFADAPPLVIGPDGAAGANGVNGSAQPGFKAATATALAGGLFHGTDSDNNAQAKGGTGGPGGSQQTIPPSAGGAGGDGGDASATADGTGIGNHTDEATATGGTGGTGGTGFPAASLSQPGSTGGAGGSGGTANAESEGSFLSNASGTLSISATGGTGGTGGIGGAKGTRLTHPGAGGAGGTGGTANASVSASGGTLIINATMSGGAGGTPGFNGTGTAQSSGGAGGDAHLVETNSSGPYTLSASANLNLNQYIYGGTGADSNGGSGGNGGSGSSLFEMSQTLSTTFSGWMATYGGNGGSVQNANLNAGGSGGGTGAEFFLTSSSNITTVAYANHSVTLSGPLGNGGDILSGVGNGGAGGDSTAAGSAISTGTTAGHSLSSLFTTANAGNGGNVSAAATGNGGNGGNVSVWGNASNGGPDSINIQAVGTAGNGGQGSGPGSSAGNGGGIFNNEGFTAVSSGGAPTTINLDFSGGRGGAGINGASGGNGADITLMNAINATTSGSLTIYQTAVGGAGGSADGAAAGKAGDASSTLDIENFLSVNNTLDVYAEGGIGGSNQNANAGNGGSQTAVLIFSGNNIIGGTTHAGLGSPGNALSPGGNASSTVPGVVAGNGGTATANSNITGAGTSGSNPLFVNATAYASNGGAGTGLANGGNGGEALATATGTNHGAGVIQAYADAYSGSGGTGAVNGRWGDAEANASATSLQYIRPNMNLNAQAYANAGQWQNDTDLRGIAVAVATTTSLADSFALATGYGASGSATATTVLTPHLAGLASTITATGIAPVDFKGGGIAGSAAFQDQLSDFSAQPTQSDVFQEVPPAVSTDASFLEESSPHVQSAFLNDFSQVLAGGGIKLSAAGSLSSAQQYTGSIDYQLNPLALGGNDLLVGLTNPTLIGSGLGAGDSLRFRVVRGSQNLVDQTFTTTADAQAFFTDTVLDLGAGVNFGQPGNQEIDLVLNLTSNTPGSGLAFYYVFGDPSHAVHPFHGQSGAIWNAPGNWDNNTAPDGPGIAVSIGGASPQIVTLDHDTTAGQISFNGVDGSGITGAGHVLIMDNAGATASIAVGSGNHTISAPITFSAAGLMIGVSGSQTLHINANISGPGNFAIYSTGTVSFIPGSGTAVINSFSIGEPGTATLDLTNNPLIVESTGATGNKSSLISQLSTFLSQAKNGSSGPWTGTGITSSTLAGYAASGNHSMTLAVADNAALHKTTFGGQPVDDNSLLVTIALNGDTNLDGSVGASDLLNLLKHYNTPDTSWTDGNLTEGPTITAADLLALLKNYNQFLPGFSLEPDPSSASAVPAISPGSTHPASVPEPASLALLFLGFQFLLCRRRAVSPPAP